MFFSCFRVLSCYELDSFLFFFGNGFRGCDFSRRIEGKRKEGCGGKTAKKKTKESVLTRAERQALSFSFCFCFEEKKNS